MKKESIQEAISFWKDNPSQLRLPKKLTHIIHTLKEEQYYFTSCGFCHPAFQLVYEFLALPKQFPPPGILTPMEYSTNIIKFSYQRFAIPTWRAVLEYIFDPSQ